MIVAARFIASGSHRHASVRAVADYAKVQGKEYRQTPPMLAHVVAIRSGTYEV